MMRISHAAYARSCRGRPCGVPFRGGARIVYYYLDEQIPLYALLAYAKSDQGDLTPDERRTVAALASAIKTAAKEA